MAYYSEPVRREPNYRGRPRLVTVLGDLSGALHHGFDGDGTPKGATVRLWEFADALPLPLPDDVVKLTAPAFSKAVTDREAVAEANHAAEVALAEEAEAARPPTIEERLAALEAAAGGDA